MIGMILITHGRVGVELLLATEHVVGPQAQAKAISIGPQDDMEKCRHDIAAAINEVDKGKGVVLLTDMFGGTPSNLAISFLGKARIEVLAGVNLPMLVKLASVRGQKNLLEAAVEAQEAGRKYINLASVVLKDIPA
jgi:mannose PTS system EIIA component